MDLNRSFISLVSPLIFSRSVVTKNNNNCINIFSETLTSQEIWCNQYKNSIKPWLKVHISFPLCSGVFTTSQIINVHVEHHFLEVGTVAKVRALTFSCAKSRAPDLSLIWICLSAWCNLMMTGDMAALMWTDVRRGSLSECCAVSESLSGILCLTAVCLHVW